jgi:nucleoside-diphosphate-sugar epimerase
MILLTGATGFLGSHLMRELNKRQIPLSTIARRITDDLKQHPCFLVDAISSSTQYLNVFSGVDCVVHCAARVHMMNDDSESPLEAFRETNTRATLNLAQQAMDAGVKRFVFISSIKVNGEETFNKPYTADDVPNPSDSYGISKYEAEEELLELAKTTGLEIVIIRPPLVYGPGVKANFESLMKLVSKGLPIPLGAVKNNSRSFVGLDNLVDFIITCTTHPKAVNQKFLVSDLKSLSTSELIQAIASSMSKKVVLIFIPQWMFSFAGVLLRKKDIIQRLFSSLEVDISKNKDLLGWEPPYSTEVILKKTTSYYLSKSSKLSKEGSC